MTPSQNSKLQTCQHSPSSRTVIDHSCMNPLARNQESPWPLKSYSLPS